MPLFVDDLLVIQNTESASQKLVFKLHQICKQYDMKICNTKTKIMAFPGKVPIRAKILVTKQIVQQVSYFTYLKSDTGFDKSYDIDVPEDLCDSQSYF